MAANWTQAQVLAQLNSGSRWGSATITYAFPTSGAGMYSRGEAQGFQAASATQRSLFTQALQTWDDLVVANFVLTAGGPSNIEFGYTTSAIDFAHAYFPTNGSVWFNAAYADLRSPTIGTYGFVVAIHEIGHALGLDHMGNYNGAGAHTPSSFQDSTVLSVMSYFGPSGPLRSSEVMAADWVAGDGRSYSPQTPMLNDVVAIQQMYGTSNSTRLGDTVYGFATNVTGTAANIFDFSRNLAPILTIFDSGGSDTLNLSGWSTPSYLYLGAGQFSSANQMTNNIAIAFGSVIENAVGGAGNDVINGNAVANVLEGGGGNDVLYGLGGADTLAGGAGNDTLNGGDGDDTAVFAESFASYTVSFNAATGAYSVASAASGADVVSGVERFQFADVVRSASQLTTADVAAPTLATLTPADNASAVLPSANLVLSFSETVQAGTGNITLFNANGTIARTIAVGDASQVTIAGNTVTINPQADLAFGAGYYVNVAAGGFRDLAGNAFAGLAGTTAYNFATVSANAADDYAANATTTGSVVVNGTPGRGVLNSVDDNDYFRVALSAGTSYVFTLNRSTGDRFDPWLDLYGPTLGWVTGDNDGGGTPNAQLSFTAASTGTYYLGVRNAFGTGTGTGSYTLAAAVADTRAPTLLRTTPADNATAVSPAASIVLEFSEAVRAGTGNIVIYNSNGSVARTIAAGDTSQVTISGSTATIDPAADLAFGSNYYLTVTGSAFRDLAGNAFAGLSGATAFNFATLARGNVDDFPWSTATTGNVVVNGAATTGSIETTGDHDLVKVSLTAGTTYVFDMHATGLPDPYLQLWNPAVQVIASDDDGGDGLDARITYTATTTGTYYLGAFEASGAGTGTYALSARSVGDDFPWSTSTTGTVTVNAAATGGRIEIAGDQDLFRVALVSGTTYVFDLTHTSGGLDDPQLQLWNPGVTLVASDDDGGEGLDARITFTATSSGTYYLGAAHATGSGTGAYALSARTLTDDFPWATTTPGVVAVDGAATAGTIERIGDQDLLRVTLNAGTTYAFDLVGSGLPDPYLQLWSPDVAVLAADDDGGNGLDARIVYTATVGGTYYLGAYDAGSGTGAYRVSARTFGDDFPANPTTRGVVTVNGQATTGNIEAAGDQDFLRVELVAGTTYSFEAVRETGGLSDPFLQLWNATPDLLAFDDDSGGAGNSLLAYTPTRSGTHYLGIRDYANGTGAYRVTASAVDRSAPLLSGFTPADNSTGVAVDANLVLSFSEAVSAGSGSVAIYAAGGTLVRSIPVTDTAKVTVSGSTVTINPAGDLTAGTTYYVNIPVGAFKDLANNVFAGIYGSSTFNFSTAGASFADDFPWATNTTGIVEVGGTPSLGRIDVVDDADLFKVALVAGASYVFRLERSEGGLDDPYLQLWSPGVDLLAFDDDSGGAGNSRLTYTARTSGTYYLGVVDFGSGTGAYRLSATPVGTAGNDTLVGGSAADVLLGFAGNDLLDGRGGADSLDGGSGNDIYVVDQSGDVVIEAAGGGVDTIRTDLSSLTLIANVENLAYSGSASFVGTGNALANTLTGGAGRDTLDGRAGADLMIGGDGDDCYVVDLIPLAGGSVLTGDRIAEQSTGGTDTVLTALRSFSLAPHAWVENLGFTGSGNFVGSGNALANEIVGGAGHDTLSGNLGNDRLLGGGGDDLLAGGAGDDLLSGGAGSDRLSGGSGRDSFVFSLAGGGLDRVSDFAAGDRIALTAIDFAALGPGVSANEFVRGSIALDADDRLIYNTQTGALYYDADGSGAGAAVQFALLTNKATLAATDFAIL